MLSLLLVPAEVIMMGTLVGCVGVFDLVCIYISEGGRVGFRSYDGSDGHRTADYYLVSKIIV